MLRPHCYMCTALSPAASTAGAETPPGVLPLAASPERGMGSWGRPGGHPHPPQAAQRACTVVGHDSRQRTRRRVASQPASVDSSRVHASPLLVKPAAHAHGTECSTARASSVSIPPHPPLPSPPQRPAPAAAAAVAVRAAAGQAAYRRFNERQNIRR